MFGLGALAALAALVLATRKSSNDAAPELTPGASKHTRNPSAHARGREHGAATRKPSAHDLQVAAAREFVGYVQAGGRSKARIKAYQTAMGKLKSDGIIGPKTRGRTEDLLQHMVVWPGDIGPRAPDPIKDILQRSDVKAAPVPTRKTEGHSGPGSATLVPGTHYRATLKLSGLDTLASNDQVLGVIQAKVGPWTNPAATGSGANRIATGTYAGARREIELPKEVVKFEALTPETHHLPAPRHIIDVKADDSNIAPRDTPPVAAARELFGFLSFAGGGDANKGTGNPVLMGTKEHPSKNIAAWQRRMGKIAVDGEYGPQTQRRGAALLGHAFPARTAPYHAAAAPAHAAPAAPPAPRAQPARAETQEHKAARGLVEYVNKGGRARSEVAVFQRAMGQLDPDGIVAINTKSRVASLLGSRPDWPAPITPQGDAPAPDDPKRAAQELYNYVHVYNGARKDRIAAYQHVLGVDPAGVYGPKSRARVHELIGKD